MPIFYHISLASKQASIKKRGLSPPISLTDKDGRDAWTDSFLLDLFETGRLNRNKVILVKVDIPKDWVSRTRSKSSTRVAKEFIVDLPIPPSRIKDIFALTGDIEGFLSGTTVVGKRGGRRKIKKGTKKTTDFARV